MKQLLFIALFGLTSLLNAQTVEVGDILLNGTIGHSLTLSELRSKRVKIDSIRPIPELMDMSTADSLVYIGGTYFEYFTNSKNCLLSVIKLDGRIKEVKIGSLILTNETTIESIQANFPESCQTTAEIKFYQDTKAYRTCGVPISARGKITDAQLRFFFLKEKLTRIDLWNPS
ncbi:hypothetical protein [Roseivirga sp.]|uniref:hypothetical protein n=1 Tax=Roseivirga sp. TaxID=1964215 RepID=UPI003B8BCECA